MARARIVGAGALALVLGLGPGAYAGETLGLDPDEARAGTEITVTDEGFVDPETTELKLPATCILSLDGKEVSDLCEVDAAGVLRGTFNVPETTPDGDYEVAAVADELTATARLTVSEDAPEQVVEDPEHRVISTPVGPSDKSGKTPMYIVVLVGVATLGIIVFRQWRAKHPVDPLTGDPLAYRPAAGKIKLPKEPKPAKQPPGEKKPPPPKLNIPPPPGKAGAGKGAGQKAAGKKEGPPAPAAVAGPAGAPAGPAALKLRPRPDTTAQVVLLDLDSP